MKKEREKEKRKATFLRAGEGGVLRGFLLLV